jgi:CheY-like chemotaxis protein
MKIMIVDDNPEIRRLLMNSLEHCANAFVECSNGAEALTAFEQHQPDWTIMDVVMRPMGGLEATRKIKARHADAHILILTQFDTPQMRAAAVDAGSDAFLSKDNLMDLPSVLRQSAGAATDLRPPPPV